MRIWVLAEAAKFGNYQNRHFVSVSAELGIELKLVSPDQLDLIATRGGKRSIRLNGEITDLPDCLLPRMGAETTYFGHAVIRHLERLGVFVLNTSESIVLAGDKLATSQVLGEANIPIPKTMLCRFPLNIDLVAEEFGFPLVMKKFPSSKGKGVILVNSRQQLEDLAGLMDGVDGRVNLIIQEYLEQSKGRDVRVFVVGGRALGAMVRTAKSGFKSNVHLGGTVEKLELTPEMEWLATECARIMGLNMAGVDLLFDENGFKVCEVNSAPGFEGLERALGIGIAQQIFTYIQVRLGKPALKRANKEA